MRKLALVIAAMLLAGHGVWGQQAGQVTAQLSPVPLYPGDGNIPPELKDYFVFLDPETWDLVVSYPEGDSTSVRKRFKVGLARHVVPSLAVEVKKQASGSYSYRYTVSNRGNARQAIKSWYLSVPRPKAPDPADPSSRTVSVPAGPWRQIDYAFSPGNWSKRWDSQEVNANIRPGMGPQSFQIQTENKPGFTTAYFQGPTPHNEIALHGMPQRVIDQLELCQDLQFNSASVSTLGPMFAPGTLRVVIAGDFHVGISMLIKQGRLDAASPFIKDALFALQQFIELPRGDELTAEVDQSVQFPTISEKPSTPAESEIEHAMKLAFDLKD
jgi:hypothetical protein